MAGIYLHIPFCKQACSYCDFYFTTRLSLREDFVPAVLNEIILQQSYFQQGTEIQSIYFGGGTPSLLSAYALEQILSKLHSTFTVHPNAEITLEANPDDLKPETLTNWYALGINRLSLGLQSIEENDLRWMHRAHTAKQALESVDLIRSAGFKNFTLDLIYGIPGSGMKGWEKNLDFLKSSETPHFSAYALTVEKRTRLYQEIQLGKTQEPLEEEMIAQFLKLQEFADFHNYEAYEISNYARQGQRARHNSSYWYQQPYLGLGPAAHSYRATQRIANAPNLNSYLEKLSKSELPDQEVETLSLQDQVNEFIMTRLRLSEGLPKSDYALLAGHALEVRCADTLKEFIQSGWLIEKPEYWKLSKSGRLQADGVSAALFWGTDETN
jgi:oxygen-independent coproporphyrinogen-3 oxidase